MLIESKHIDDTGLRRLVFGDEETDEYRRTVEHVERCHECQARLSKLASTAEFERDVNSFLCDKTRLRGPLDESSVESVPFEFLGPPSHPEMLGRLGRYEVERVIGSGGMGIVLKAFDSELNRPVAIKVQARHLANHEAARERFAREARAVAAVVHEHVVAIHNVETEGNLPFLVMQYIAGESLQTRVDRDGPLGVEEILRVGIQAAAGLAAAHEQGVIHRDVKPGNILLENGLERALLTDFGLARTVDDASLTNTGIIAGTPHYMSPEQANGDATDHRTDLFSLGAVLYFMATGEPPFKAERAMGVLNRVCHARHRPLVEAHREIPYELSDVVDRLLEKKPSRRIAHATELKDTLARLLAASQQGQLRSRRQNKYRWRRAIVVTALLGVAAFVIAVQRPTLPGEPEASVIPESEMAQDVDPGKVEALKAEEVAESSEVRSVVDQLDRLDSMSQMSSFARPGDDGFQKSVASYDQLLDRLDGDVFPRTSTLLQNGEK